MTDWVGWAGTFVMAVASIYIAHKNVLGMWLMLAGNVLWAVVGYRADLPSLIAVSVLMGLLDLYGVFKWEQKPRTRYDDLMAPPPNGHHKRRSPYEPRQTPRPMPPRLWNPED